MVPKKGDDEPEPVSVTGPEGEAVIMPPNKRGQGRKVPRGHEQYHGFWRVIYYPGPSQKMLTAPEVLQAKDEEEARSLAKRAAEEGFEAVRKNRYSRM